MLLKKSIKKLIQELKNLLSYQCNLTVIFFQFDISVN